MARTPKPSPMAAFQANLADAEALLAYAHAFTNQRTNRMRRELRQRIGDALRMPPGKHDDLDCLESDDLFVVCKPKSRLRRESFRDLRPLLRQALVAGCAALETFVADKALEFVSRALRSNDAPKRLSAIPLTIGQWMDIEQQYERKGWGIRRIVEEHLRELSSCAPSQVGQVLSTIGVTDWSAKVDRARGVAKGTTVQELETISNRRDLIAHTGDRRGQGRAKLQPGEVERDLQTLRSVASGIEDVLAGHAI